MNATATSAAAQASVLVNDVMRARTARARGAMSTDITSMATIDWMASRLDWAGYKTIDRIIAWDAKSAEIMAAFDAENPDVTRDAMKAAADEILWESDGQTWAHLRQTYELLKGHYGVEIAAEFVTQLGYGNAVPILR